MENITKDKLFDLAQENMIRFLGPISEPMKWDITNAYEKGFRKALELIKEEIDSKHRETEMNKILDTILKPFQELL